VTAICPDPGAWVHAPRTNKNMLKKSKREFWVGLGK